MTADPARDARNIVVISMSYGGRPPQRPQQRVSQRTYTIRRLTALGVVVVFIGGLWFGATAIFGGDE